MLVKDKLTGERKPKEELYCVTTEYVDRNGHNKRRCEYYTSEDAYKKYLDRKTLEETENKYRMQSIDILMDVLHYSGGQKLPTILFKKLKDFADAYSYECVYYTVKDQVKSMEWAYMTKDFNSELSMVNYMMAIIQNNLMTVWRKILREQKAAAKEKINVVETNDLENIGINTKKGTGVSSLLGEADWI